MSGNEKIQLILVLDHAFVPQAQGDCCINGFVTFWFSVFSLLSKFASRVLADRSMFVLLLIFFLVKKILASSKQNIKLLII